MSDLFNNQEQNITPNQNSDDLDTSDNASVTPPLEDSQSFSTHLPLPDFQSDSSEFEPQVPIKASTATPPDLNNLFTDQTSEETSDLPADSNPAYTVSPAQTDLSNYTIPPLDHELEPEIESSSGWQTTWAIVREVGETILLTLIIFFVIQMFIRNFRVVGTSMVNNLHDGQYLIVDKVSYSPFLMENIGIGGPTRGDVIVFKPPRNLDDDYVKRVIGLPGETIEIRHGQVFVNGQLLEEPFKPVSGSYSSRPVVVPEDQIFVLGDNRNNSNDSHNWGVLPIENIVGRAWISYWPPEQWGVIPRDAPSEEATLMHFVGRFIPAANAQNE